MDYFDITFIDDRKEENNARMAEGSNSLPYVRDLEDDNIINPVFVWNETLDEIEAMQEKLVHIGCKGRAGWWVILLKD